MKTPNPPRLAVEPFEGRVLPARFAPVPPIFGHAVEARAEFDRAPRPAENRLSVDRVERIVPVFGIFVINRPAEPSRPVPQQPAESVPETPPPAESGGRILAGPSRGAAVAFAVATDHSRADLPAPAAGAESRPAAAPQSEVAPAGSSAAGSPAPRFYAGSTEAVEVEIEVAQKVPPAVEATTAAGTTAKASLLDIALDSLIPESLPLHGVLPLVDEFLDLRTGEWLEELGQLGDEFVDGVPAWERGAWIAGAVLVLGGAAHAVGARRRNRAVDPTVLGTDSALTQEEWPRGPRTNG